MTRQFMGPRSVHFFATLFVSSIIMMRNSFRVLIINGISPNKTIVASVMFGNLISFRLPFHTQATPSLAACLLYYSAT